MKCVFDLRLDLEVHLFQDWILIEGSIDPPRSSSQFEPHSILSIGSPVSCEIGRAVGMNFDFPAPSSVLALVRPGFVVVVDLRHVRV